MKKLDLLVIKTFLGPFILTFFITLLILVMQFLWVYVEDLVGKGLEWYIVIELLFYASASLITLALPLAILLSSIMTFGNFGENYELVAIKSSGISLQRVMRPLILFSLILCLTAFYFSNSLWPKANLKFSRLLYDITTKKPTLEIRPEIFYKGIDNYVIRVGKKDSKTNELKDIIIYDHTKLGGNNNVIKAERGKMYLIPNQNVLIFEIYNGFQYEEVQKANDPLFRAKFKKHVMRIDLKGFDMNNTDESIWKNHYEMMTLSQLDISIDSLKIDKEKHLSDFRKYINQRLIILFDSNYTLDSNIIASYTNNNSDSNLLKGLKSNEIKNVYSSALNSITTNLIFSKNYAEDINYRTKIINRHYIEWHRKFTLSIACLLLFFIGAPLGAIIRKGGLGMPVVVAVIFFLLWHITSIIGEKIVKQDELPAFIGMWISTVLFAPLGIYLTYKATSDSIMLDSTFYKILLNPFINLFNKIKSKKH